MGHCITIIHTLHTWKAYLMMLGFYDKSGTKYYNLVTHLKRTWRVLFPRMAKNSDINRNIHRLVECEAN